MRSPKGKSSGVTSSRASGLTGSWETKCAVSIAPASGSSETKLVGDSRYSEPGPNRSGEAEPRLWRKK